MGIAAGSREVLSGPDQLLANVSDQLSQTFLQILRLSELAKTTSSPHVLEQISVVSDAAMRLMEAYGTSIRAGASALQLNLEPVAVSSLLHEAVHALTPFAKQHNIQLELAPMPKLEPVLCDRALMHSALVSLGQVFVAAEAEQEEPRTVRFDAYRTRYGIVTGLYTHGSELTSTALTRARKLYGHAKQPMGSMGSGPLGGVFVADRLLQAMATELHVARHDNHTGLAATLLRCDQMQLV